MVDPIGLIGLAAIAAFGFQAGHHFARRRAEPATIHEAHKLSGLVGAVVISFETRGCMATDHVFQWIGIVDRIEYRTSHGTGDKQHKVAIVRIVKADDYRDWRDWEFPDEEVWVMDGSFQRLASGLFMWCR